MWAELRFAIELKQGEPTDKHRLSRRMIVHLPTGR
jgi:hypothetical protein